MRTIFLGGAFHLGTEKYWLGKWDDAGKIKLICFPFCYSPVFFFHYVAEVSEVDSRLLPELFLFVDSCLITDLHRQTEAGFSFVII